MQWLHIDYGVLLVLAHKLFYNGIKQKYHVKSIAYLNNKYQHWFVIMCQ